MLMVPNLRLVEPNNIYRKVPTRKPNAEMRTREYLTPAEVEKLIAAAKLGRYGHRDATLILVAFRHGLRAGRRSSGAAIRRCTSAGSRTASPRCIPSAATSCACCASCSGTRRVRLFSRPNAAAHSRLTPSIAS